MDHTCIDSSKARVLGGDEAELLPGDPGERSLAATFYLRKATKLRV